MTRYARRCGGSRCRRGSSPSRAGRSRWPPACSASGSCPPRGPGWPCCPAATSIPRGWPPCSRHRLGCAMRATLAYTTARILLFVAAVGLFYLAGARGLLLLGLALLVSGAASYVLLSRQRDAMSGALVNRFRTMRARIDEGARAEDER